MMLGTMVLPLGIAASQQLPVVLSTIRLCPLMQGKTLHYAIQAEAHEHVNDHNQESSGLHGPCYSSSLDTARATLVTMTT